MVRLLIGAAVLAFRYSYKSNASHVPDQKWIALLPEVGLLGCGLSGS